MTSLPRLLLVLCLALPATAAAGTHHIPGHGPGHALPLFHGNWCGLGDADRAAPVDALDAACRAHDLCYEARGRGACGCDRAFLRATARLMVNRRVDEGVRSKAATANSLFSATPCTASAAPGSRARIR